MKFTRYLFLFAMFLGQSPLASAQDEFFDDEEYFEEPYEEDFVEPETANTMPAIQPRGRPSAPDANSRPSPSPRPSMGGTAGPSGLTGSSSGEVEFRVVDPPKYWTPKKRTRTKPPARSSRPATE